MKEVIVHSGAKVEIIDSPVPVPKAGQVLIKVVVSGCNPKDWKVPFWMNRPQNSGDDIAGIVEAVGEKVYEFRPGDRVAAFHEMMAPHGSFAEYAIAEQHTTFHLPRETSFEEAATIPLAAMTAAIGLYMKLRLPEPWHPTLEPIPIIIYGAATAVGAFAIKLAKASNIHPIIAVAGKGEGYVETLIDRTKGDVIVDYRKGDEAVVSDIKDIIAKAGIKEVKYAFDAVSEKGSYQNCIKVLAQSDSHITCVLPIKDFKFPSHVQDSLTMVGACHSTVDSEKKEGKAGFETNGSDFAFCFLRLFARGLQQGWFTPHPHQIIAGGLNGVGNGLNKLMNGEASAVKYVYRISDAQYE